MTNINNKNQNVYTTLDRDLVKRKSLFIALVFWFFGGFFGLHHFYLNRDRHAFVTWATLAGYFGFGWFIDLFMLSNYVKDYNEDVNYIENLIELMKKNSKPPHSHYRGIASLVVSAVFGYLTDASIPLEYFDQNSFSLRLIRSLILPFSIAVGVHLIGNIGRQQGSFKIALIGSYVCLPLYLFFNYGILINSGICFFIFERHAVEWRRKKVKEQSLTKRLFYLSLAASLYISLWSSWIWFNCKYNVNEDKIVKCRDSIKDFFNSPSWREMKELIRDIRVYIQVHGVSSVLNEFYSLLSGKSIDSALEVLGLPTNATSSEISHTYRKLSRIYHPDKQVQKSDGDKLLAENKFILIQNAYRLLLELGRVKRKFDS